MSTSWAQLAKGAAGKPATASNAAPSMPAAAAAPAPAPVSVTVPSPPAPAAAAAAASAPSASSASSSSPSAPSVVAPAPVSVPAVDIAPKKVAGKKKGPKGPNTNGAPPPAVTAPVAASVSSSSAAGATFPAPPALLTTNSSHSTPSSAISTPLAVPSGGPSASPFHNSANGAQQQQHAQAAPSSAASTPTATSNSNPGSPARKGRKKGGGGNHHQSPQQNGHGPQQHHPHPQHANGPQHHPQQQQQSYPSNWQPYAFPLAVGPNGLPLPLPPLAGPALVGGVGGGAPPMYLLPQGAGAGGPYMSGPPQFPAAPMIPPFQYAPHNQQHQHQHHHGKRHHNGGGHSHANNSAGTFYPGPSYYAASSSSSAPYSYSPQQQMANIMSLAAASSAGPTLMYPSALSAAAPNSIHGVLPALPVPFAMAPFADLLSSVPLPPPSAPYFSVDVECIATGPGHNDRAIGHVAVVDAAGEVVLNVYIKPKGAVTSYLPALTGLSESLCAQGVSEEEAIALFKACIPTTAVLVGQNVLKDVQWLRLEEGTDFASMLDLAGLFATKHPKYKSLTFFSLSHEAKALLCLDQQEQHHPAIDALLSIRLYQLYTLLQMNPSELERARTLLLEHPVAGAFNKTNPVYDGVCMGNRKECKCGSPWLG